MNEYLLHTYNPLPIQFTRGENVWLFDSNDKRYLDSLCGIAVTGLGHNHPAVINAIKQQAEKVLHLSNLVEIPQQQALAKALSEACGFHTKAFLGNSGAEAVEGLIKLSRLFGHQKGIQNPKVLTLHSSFHGRTMGCISACGGEKVKKGFDPLLPGFVHAPYNDIKAVKEIAKQDKDIVAIMVEPVQGEGGIIVPADNYLSQLRQICDEQNWLLMVDEIQTGMGRTGQLFAFQHENIKPDAISIAKGLANGVPIGAFLVAEQHAELFQPGSHGSTFGGNPLSCAVGLATLETIRQQKLYENAAKQGQAIRTGLSEALHNNPHVKDVRGKGLMIGVELDRPCRAILHKALDEGIIFNITKENTIRLLPPLIIEEHHVSQIIEKVTSIVETFVAETV